MSIVHTSVATVRMSIVTSVGRRTRGAPGAAVKSLVGACGRKNDVRLRRSGRLSDSSRETSTSAVGSFDASALAGDAEVPVATRGR
jgi:hypothetical protein